ncbi:MAG: isopenicillin N synthase family oxygenase [Gammaproteobacteria bacterium]|nr:isopenicillin N synthase family oxygenase [Gammaproteobacteria bacterium]
MFIETVNYTDSHAPQQFVRSLHQTGFGVLTNHPIQQSTVDSLSRQWKKFFLSDDKYRFQYTPDKFDGFFPVQDAEAAKGRDIRDLKEYFQFYPWGQCPDWLREETLEYFKFARQFAAKLLRWIADYSPPSVASGYTQPLPDMLNGSAQSMLRVLHYPPLRGDEAPAAIRAAAHEDINLLTLLPVSHEPGLQVQKLDGEWLDVPCEFGHLIVNTGDMLQEASRGYFPSTSHRVINPAQATHNRSRISMPLFLHPHPQVVLSKRYTANSYLTERMQELQRAVD